MNDKNDKTGTSKRGFASMSPERVHEIAEKGGHASAEKAGREGMAERGHLGGEISAQRAGHEGMSERGHLGGLASGEVRRRNKEERERAET